MLARVWDRWSSKGNCAADILLTWLNMVWNMSMSNIIHTQVQKVYYWPKEIQGGFPHLGTITKKKEKRLFINMRLAIRRLNKYILYGKGFLKVRRPLKVPNEMKCTKEKMTWNTQDTNLSWYVPKTNVDHTISGLGTAISILDHSATSPRALMDSNFVNLWIVVLNFFDF